MIPFGSVPYSSLLAFCGGSSLDDNCMGHGIALLNVKTLMLESSTLYSCVSSFENSSTRLSKPIIPLWKQTRLACLANVHAPTIKRETRSRQPDGSSCGVAVLTFFECFLSGIAIPDKPSLPLMRFLRLRYMLKCLT
ncbi:hypothetical protein GQ600_55 [Phytophthora cactorum]|nr:hypothetical protein GQ600_55 [Phytophthora cactorum]